MSIACQRCHEPNDESARYCLQCGALLEVEGDEGDPLLGKVIVDRYRVRSVLGEGGMGKVYLAEQKMGNSTREVALKTLHPELSQDKQLVERFHRECDTVIKLTHPNTIQFYDFGELPDRTLYIVMEHIDGASLADVLAHGPMDPGRVDLLLIQICGSLHEAHQRGIVHRDLKPENILLTDRGGHAEFVKVLDFGIAKSHEAEAEGKGKLTKQGMVLGTPPYMSPEQFSGKTLDARSDVYSLALMTYEMLTGRLPFEAATPWEWATHHLTTTPEPLSSLPEVAGLPANKSAAVMRALEKSADARQSNVMEFLREFTGYQDPQAAWTLATVSSEMSAPASAASTSSPGRAPGSGERPRAAAPTPGPMPQSREVDPLAATGFHDTGDHAMAPPENDLGDYDPLARPSRAKGSAALWVALSVLLGASGGITYYFLAGNTPDAQAGASAENGAVPAGTPSNLGTPRPRSAAEGTQGAETAPSLNQNVPSPDDARPQDDDAPANDPSTHVANDPGGRAEDPDSDRNADQGDDAEDVRSSAREGGSAARSRKIATARDALKRGESALNARDIDGALNALRAAQTRVGRNHPLLTPLRNALGQKASNKVGILMQTGKCAEAQTLFRRLRLVRADRASRAHFSGDWCPLP